MPLKPGHTIQNRVFKDPQQRPASTSLFQGLLCCVQSFHLLGAVFLLSSGTKFCSPSWLAAAPQASAPASYLESLELF